jgi:hypothetical protein
MLSAHQLSTKLEQPHVHPVGREAHLLADAELVESRDVHPVLAKGRRGARLVGDGAGHQAGEVEAAIVIRRLDRDRSVEVAADQLVEEEAVRVVARPVRQGRLHVEIAPEGGRVGDGDPPISGVASRHAPGAEIDAVPDGAGHSLRQVVVRGDEIVGQLSGLDRCCREAAGQCRQERGWNSGFQGVCRVFWSGCSNAEPGPACWDGGGKLRPTVCVITSSPKRRSRLCHSAVTRGMSPLPEDLLCLHRGPCNALSTTRGIVF